MLGLLSGWVKIHKIPHGMVLFETTSQFFKKNSNHSSVSWEITLSYLFSWNFILFWWKKPHESALISDFRFHQIFTLIGSFCWNYVKLQLKKYREVVSHDLILICCFKTDKNLVNFDPSTQNSQKFTLWLVPSMKIMQLLI